MEVARSPGGGAPPRRLTQIPRWLWFGGGAVAFGLLPILLAFTQHNRGTTQDPDCVRHCYTLVHDAGPGVLLFVGAPMVIAVVVLGLLWLRQTGKSRAGPEPAWVLTTISGVVCLVGLIVVGIAMLPAGFLTAAAVATAPD